MSRKDFNADHEDLSLISISKLTQAAEEDLHKKPISNPKIHKPMKHLKITAGQVIGTNQSCASIQSQIWSLSIKFGPLALWVTVNPSDIHDPIVQVFCREHINLDHFD